MTNNIFCLNYSVTGSERKRLVNAIADFTQADPRYLGAPSFAYEVDYFAIDKNGCVSFDDRADSEEIEGLIEALASQGFVARDSDTGHDDSDEPQEPPTAETDSLTISMPKDGFTEAALDNLRKLLDAKGTLIQKALGADRLTVETTGDRVSFPWWDAMPTPDEVQAYLAFVAALCAMAKSAKRVTATEKDVESEKYAFRGFLLRLGFIGAESKAHRKLLLKNLSGSAAFPSKEKADAFNAAQKARRNTASAETGKEMPA